ncbi:MAG: methylmalonyl-CoA mutase family protein [Lutibacter sp.]|nr:methylmalonyl-CoA mutase family protein [Lutibacter sp.]
MNKKKNYTPKHKVRIVTAASLFDGHDAAINIMRRIMQSTGVEVIHLGHDRSVEELADCAIQEGAHAIAITSYQGGHMEYFSYLYDLLKEKGAGHIKLFGGGGGVILPSEIKQLTDYGISRIYSPDDGRTMGLQGMINDLVEKADFPIGDQLDVKVSDLKKQRPYQLAMAISAVENFADQHRNFIQAVKTAASKSKTPVLGVTGTGGSGKSSSVDEFIRRYLEDFPDKTVGIISVDPSKKKSGGALLGDRIRMNALKNPRVYMRSLATRQANLALSKHVATALDILKAANFDLIILETSGIGQSDTEILDHAAVSLYVMTPDFGAATQLEKIDMIDFADVIALNKFDKRGAEDALRAVQKQYQRAHELWEKDLDTMPVYGTVASQFNDPGTHTLYQVLLEKLNEKTGARFQYKSDKARMTLEKQAVIPPGRTRYLSEISESNRQYKAQAIQQKNIAQKLYGLFTSLCTLTGMAAPEAAQELLCENGLEEDRLMAKLIAEEDRAVIVRLLEMFRTVKRELSPDNWQLIRAWKATKQAYRGDSYSFTVRNQTIDIQTHSLSLSQLRIPKISLPSYEDWGSLLWWLLEENLPGEFPYTAGIYPFKRAGEDPTRMFAGEGGPERTNRRFHYLSLDMPAKRLSTAFDSVTLYGSDPDIRPDIYGKIGNAGVSVCCLDDAKKLYSGIDLCDPATSVSMTINGPAPMMLGFFMNAAIDQACEQYIMEQHMVEDIEKKIGALYAASGDKRPSYQGVLPEGHNGLGLLLLGVTGDQVLPAAVYQKIKAATIRKVRGTVQADILKEDQAQNTCIFSTEFALRLMGDVQEYFIENQVRNFYSVSISGYHIAEAGANPITQLAFTLANGFTYIEYYLSRGMDINKFGPNLSFFFSNGIDPEYAVIGRVARKIWSKALKIRYGANARAQMLKYHIQTSGRSLHAQEIDFNDIRTTLQALYAIYDNCNSLHTNAYDEAITTPTEESVRRAMAIQLIINKELGLTRNENPLQGAFITEELTALVEEAVYTEFDRLTDRGGVLGAMETMYQRSKIQEESMQYESQKHSGELPVIGVNTFLSSQGSPTVLPQEVIRATETEKKAQVTTVGQLYKRNPDKAAIQVQLLKEKARTNDNLFEQLMEACKVCSLGQLTEALFEVGGQYRRNM